jgi:hypothetical protein
MMLRFPFTRLSVLCFLNVTNKHKNKTKQKKKQKNSAIKRKEHLIFFLSGLVCVANGFIYLRNNIIFSVPITCHAIVDTWGLSIVYNS